MDSHVSASVWIRPKISSLFGSLLQAAEQPANGPIPTEIGNVANSMGHLECLLHL